MLISIAASIYYLNSQKAGFNPTEEISAIPNEIQAQNAEVSEKVQVSGYIPDENAVNRKKSLYQQAPELTGIAGYINTNADIKIYNLKGKVVLVDFWTYTCINCIRTFPYLKSWHEKYAHDGLVIIGVHTPEFEFEKKYENVKSAVEKYGLKYAVVQDNDYATWRAYKNRYWPHKYLIDIDGFVRYDHIGEGAYAETERVIKELLSEKMEREGNVNPLVVVDEDVEAVGVEFGKVGTPEIYFGYGFARGNFGNEQGLPPEEIVDYKLPEEIKSNYAYLGGTWKINNDDSELISDEGKIILPYSAKVLNIVAGSEQGSEIEVFVDNEPLNKENKGSDMKLNDPTKINDFKLYNLIDFEYGTYTVQINIKGKGFKINTFTFG
ncbi:thioredoxin family protein [Candidatus Woesearchaeota archaeon]|nr:thioredoxin family protein [Candidatus Woesearchaeota archaeon]